MKLCMQALQHPWLKGGPEERSTGKALSLKVVQRIQVCQQALYNPMAMNFLYHLCPSAVSLVQNMTHGSSIILQVCW